MISENELVSPNTSSQTPSIQPNNTISPFTIQLANENENFIGRGKALEKLTKMLNNGKTKTTKAVIAGIGGVGKSQLARAYAHSHYSKYDLIIWIDASGDLPSQYKALAEALNIASVKTIQASDKQKQYEEIAKAVKKHISESQQNWLIIFDNVKGNWPHINKVYAPQQKSKAGKKGHILITTRAWEQGNCLELREFEVEDALAFVARWLPDISKKERFGLAKTMQFLPLALAQAIAYLNTHDINVEKYCQLFKRKRKKLWDQEQALLEDEGIDKDMLDDYELTIRVTLTISIKDIQENASAFQLLIFCSLLHSLKIPAFIISEWISKLDKLNDPDDVELEKQKRVRVLFKHSLLSPYDIENSSFYDIHELVQKVTADLALPEQKLEQLLLAIDLVSGFEYSQTDTTKIKQLEQLLAHVKSLLKKIEDEDHKADFGLADEITESADQLYYTLGVYYLHRRHEYQRANNYFEKALSQCRNTILQRKIYRQLAKVKIYLKDRPAAKQIYDTLFDSLQKNEDQGLALAKLSLGEIDILCDMGNFYSKEKASYEYDTIDLRDYFASGTASSSQTPRSVKISSLSKRLQNENNAKRYFGLALDAVSRLQVLSNSQKAGNHLIKKEAEIINYLGKHYFLQAKNTKPLDKTFKYKYEYLMKAWSCFQETLTVIKAYDNKNISAMADISYSLAFIWYEAEGIIAGFKNHDLVNPGTLKEAEIFLMEATNQYKAHFSGNESAKVLEKYLKKLAKLTDKINTLSSTNNTDKQPLLPFLSSSGERFISPSTTPSQKKETSASSGSNGLTPSKRKKQTYLDFNLFKGYKKIKYTNELSGQSEEDPILENSQLEKKALDLSDANYHEALSTLLQQWEQSALEQAIQRSLEDDQDTKQALRNRASQFGFDCQDVAGDGNCFFHAVLHQLQIKNIVDTQDLNAALLRERALHYLLNHIDSYADYFGEEVNAFFNRLLNGEWADHVFIDATAKVLDITITIIGSYESDPTIINPGDTQAYIVLGHEGIKVGQTIRGRHYQSLIANTQLTPIYTIESYLNKSPEYHPNNGNMSISNSSTHINTSSEPSQNFIEELQDIPYPSDEEMENIKNPEDDELDLALAENHSSEANSIRP